MNSRPARTLRLGLMAVWIGIWWIPTSGCSTSSGLLSRDESARSQALVQSSRSRLNELIPEERAYEDLRWHQDPEDTRRKRR